jgi:hypothetical protein
MHALAISTVLFQALATVALVLGAAAESFFPARRWYAFADFRRFAPDLRAIRRRAPGYHGMASGRCSNVTT